MKKNILTLLLLFVAIVNQAQIPLTHNINNSSVDRFATSCGIDLDSDGTQDTILEGSLWRSYTPSDFGITNDIRITDAFYVSASATSSEASTSATIRLYTTDAPFPTGNLTEITSEEVTLNIGDSGNGKFVPLSDPFVASPNEEIVVQFEFTNTDSIDFAFNWIGANDDGQTAPSYFSSEDCGFFDIIDLEEISPNNHIVLNLVAEDVLSVDDNVLSANIISLYPNPTNTEITLDFSKNIEETNIQIATISGQVVMSKKINGVSSTIVDTSKLATGIYFAHISSVDTNTTIKFIKN